MADSTDRSKQQPDLQAGKDIDGFADTNISSDSINDARVDIGWVPTAEEDKMLTITSAQVHPAPHSFLPVLCRNCR